MVGRTKIYKDPRYKREFILETEGSDIQVIFSIDQFVSTLRNCISENLETYDIVTKSHDVDGAIMNVVHNNELDVMCEDRVTVYGDLCPFSSVYITIDDMNKAKNGDVVWL